jgi:retinol dehydrogenase-12
MGWTVEKRIRAYIHAMASEKDSHEKYLSLCQFKPESQFVQSERGRRIQEKMWNDVMKRIQRICREVAEFIR